ncbi:hypothetical protein SKAU_G00373380 [Synaphobranchus kaupii]|uniref:Uncharacterized protein n=1 Tax=Synaphobranchus kaupii TaxID=118154 RepID=A0A9Q1IG16_SYNKA|nr:hypothetical protein SKAU_G00373380 [Synaphobranchus kaupii]
MEGQEREPAGYRDQETTTQTGGRRASGMSTSMAGLRSSFAQQGFLSGLPVLGALELQAAREAFGKLEKEFGEYQLQAGTEKAVGKGVKSTPSTVSTMSISNTNWVMALAKHPRVLEPVRAILGPDVILLDSRFICKYPALSVGTSIGQVGNDITTFAKQSSALDNDEGNYGKARTGQQDKPGLPFVAWHQDMRYWGLAGGPVLSVWLAFDDSLKDNGALRVIPGSHCSGLLPHRLSPHSGNMLSVNQEIPEQLVKIDEAVLCPLLARADVYA